MYLSYNAGNRGDELYPNKPWVHVFVSWHHQRERQRRAEDLLCSHRDDQISVTGDCDALSTPHKQNKKT